MLSVLGEQNETPLLSQSSNVSIEADLMQEGLNQVNLSVCESRVEELESRQQIAQLLDSVSISLEVVHGESSLV